MDNGRQPATKQDLLELEDRVNQRMLALEDRVKQGMSGLENRFIEALHDAETKLLRAFYSFAEATQKHFNDLDRSDSSLRERLGTCENRITEIEKRLNTPRP